MQGQHSHCISDQSPAFRDSCHEYMSHTLPFFPFAHWQLHCTPQMLPDITKCLSVPSASSNFGMAEHHCSRVPPPGFCTSEEEHGWSRKWSESIPYSYWAQSAGRRAQWQLESTASSPLNLNKLIDSAPLAISYVLHASVGFYKSPKKSKGKKPRQNKPTFLSILLINQDSVLPPWDGSCDLLFNYFRSLLILTQWATATVIQSMCHKRKLHFCDSKTSCNSVSGEQENPPIHHKEIPEWACCKSSIQKVNFSNLLLNFAI